MRLHARLENDFITAVFIDFTLSETKRSTSFCKNFSSVWMIGTNLCSTINKVFELILTLRKIIFYLSYYDLPEDQLCCYHPRRNLLRHRLVAKLIDIFYKTHFGHTYKPS